MGNYVDALKFAVGSFSLMPRTAVRELLDLCHQHDVLVSTGGFIEHVLTRGPEAVDYYVGECKELGFDIIEISETRGRHPVRRRRSRRRCQPVCRSQPDRPTRLWGTSSLWRGQVLTYKD